MTELYIPTGIPEAIKQKILADKEYILKYQELSKTKENWQELSDAERKQLARQAIGE